MVAVIVIIIVAVIVLVTLARTIRIVPQARAGVVERLGRYSRTLSPRLAMVVPLADPGPAHGGPVRRRRAPAPRPPRAGGLVPAAAGDHRGQPRRQHRLGHILPGHRGEG